MFAYKASILRKELQASEESWGGEVRGSSPERGHELMVQKQTVIPENTHTGNII